ncbi:MAG: hypothetical protein LBH49_02455 [Puniceicoccales bacterium]|jgi:hypothetical protein|nr:hypothetical protein [Puniceicoccales bacterium]
MDAKNVLLISLLGLTNVCDCQARCPLVERSYDELSCYDIDDSISEPVDRNLYSLTYGIFGVLDLETLDECVLYFIEEKAGVLSDDLCENLEIDWKYIVKYIFCETKTVDNINELVDKAIYKLNPAMDPELAEYSQSVVSECESLYNELIEGLSHDEYQAYINKHDLHLNKLSGGLSMSRDLTTLRKVVNILVAKKDNMPGYCMPENENVDWEAVLRYLFNVLRKNHTIYSLMHRMVEDLDSRYPSLYNELVRECDENEFQLYRKITDMNDSMIDYGFSCENDDSFNGKIKILLENILIHATDENRLNNISKDIILDYIQNKDVVLYNELQNRINEIREMLKIHGGLIIF